jgi:glycosyltransferase involved in cell wall biosynthesis
MIKLQNLAPKKKLLIMVDWFSPGYKAGGPIQSCVNLAKALKNEYEIFVLTSDTDHGETTPYPGIEPNCWHTDLFPGINVFYINALTFKRSGLTALIHTIQPDFIYLNHLFSPFYVILPLWLKWRNKIGGKIILCPRGALHKSALSEKSYKKLPFLFLMKTLRMNQFIRFHATNEKEQEEIAHHFPGSTIFIANNLPESGQPELKMTTKIKGDLRCIFISRIVPIKNLLFLLEILETTSTTINLTIAGPVEDENYWNSCRKKLNSLPSSVSVKYIGSLTREEIKNSLQQHHLYLLPTTGENFGHSIFESFLMGRPVLISNRTPWLPSPEKKTGWALPLDEPQSFRQAIETAAAWDQKQFEEYAHSSWNFAQQFIHNPESVNQYKTLFS